MRITRLEAKGIGPFEDLNIEFKPKPAGMENKAEIHILTGENGTGKSTILIMLASCADKDNDVAILKRSRNRYNIDYYIETDNGLPFLFDDTSSFYLKGSVLEYLNYRKENKYINRINYPDPLMGVNNNFAFAYSGYRIMKGGDGNVNIGEIIDSPYLNAINFEKSIESDLILKWVANVTAKKLISQSQGKKKNNVDAVTKMEKALSDITGKQIVFFLDETLTVSLIINSIKLNFNILPDGLKSIISWLSDLLMRLDRIDWMDKSRSIFEQNFILFLDEIEVHSHPSWQRKILPVVQDLFPNAQIFISTHSPFVVGSVDGARVYKFKLDENNNSVLDSEYWTEDGNSYQYYLREVFDIKNEFGVKIDESLQKLQQLKEKALKGSAEDYEKFMILSDKLLNENPNSVELSSIVGFERRKLEKQYPPQPVTA